MTFVNSRIGQYGDVVFLSKFTKVSFSFVYLMVLKHFIVCRRVCVLANMLSSLLLGLVASGQDTLKCGGV